MMDTSSLYTLVVTLAFVAMCLLVLAQLRWYDTLLDNYEKWVQEDHMIIAGLNKTLIEVRESRTDLRIHLEIIFQEIVNQNHITSAEELLRYLNRLYGWWAWEDDPIDLIARNRVRYPKTTEVER